MSRNLRWTGRDTGQIRTKGNWEVYTGGQWVDLDVDGGALPGDVSANNDYILFDSNALRSVDSCSQPPAYASDYEVAADYPYSVWAPGAPINPRYVTIRKTCTIPANQPLAAGTYKFYAYNAWMWGIWGATAFHFYANGTGFSHGPYITPATVFYASAVRIANPSGSQESSTNPPDVAEVTKGLSFENGTKVGLARVNKTVQTGSVPVAVL